LGFTSVRASLYMKRVRGVLVAASMTGCLILCWKQATIHAAPRSSAVAATSMQEASGSSGAGAKTYADNCAICHGDHREGNLPAFPPLLGVQHHLSDAQIVAIIEKGKDRMPAVPDVKDAELTSLLEFLHSNGNGPGPSEALNGSPAPSSAVVDAGRELFQQNCAFCHGRDTMGGETGPDLTRSKIVLADMHGEKISQVVREGRPAKKMPAFNFSAPELEGLVAFIHAQATLAAANKGGRRGVDVDDLQTGNAEAGKRYFDGPGGCAKCHSASGDLAGVATRYEGLALEMRMLYPEGAKSTVAVKLPSGQQVAGTLVYQDEFTVGLRDQEGNYRSWPANRVSYKVNSPVEAHVDQFGKYTDADIHNLMAYLQTLR
jgi:mono/diheme cytochrome c family protein